MPGNLPVNQIGVGQMRHWRDASEAFSETVGPLFETQIDAPEDGNQFRAELASYFLGHAVFFEADMGGAAYHFMRDRKRIAQSGLDIILIQMLLEGEDIRTVDGETVAAQPGDICIADMSRTFRSETASCHNLTLALPRHMIFERENQLDALHGLTIKASSVAGKLLGSHFRTIRQSLAVLTPDEAPIVARATANLVATLAAPLSEGRINANGTVRGTTLMEIRRYIDQKLAAPNLGPDHLCRAFGLSRATLYRLFEPIGGVTDFIRSRRLQRAFDLLRQYRERSVGEVAYACGFGDVSAFSRAFRQHFGMTPTEARVAMGGPWRGTTPDAVRALDEASVQDWLRIVGAQ
ncbi:AraC family transcriptional regulator [Rhizobium sp. TRM95111]|uniref:helix-turn-helix domain-containing protein n=1 Tax=Rhizobium alarense TaxID=2846851 RepID=UPI001F42C907|nr:AraC family transcriptional regulator [Rhizobium alarense]MCF3640611.1 AraC family transcriptional regulator [Rhizobium alarense]